MNKLKNLLTRKEHGYSLLEISVAVGIMVIGLAIAIPSFNTAIQTQEANDLKNRMLSAGLIMESARYQNNGTYPTEIPEEILSNPDYADFVYSIDEGAQNYCIMGRDETNQKYFINPETSEPYQPGEEVPGCTEENIIWTPVNPNEPPAPALQISAPTMATGTNIWDKTNYAAPVASFSWASGSCDFSGPLPSYMTGVQSIDYQARVVEPSSANAYLAYNGQYITANSVTNLGMPGLLPSANIEYQVRMRCLADYEYNYTNWVSLSDIVSSFPVEGTVTVFEPASAIEWGPGQEWPILNFTAANITCPSADFTPVYRATVGQVGATTIETAWQSSVNFSIQLVGFRGNRDASWSVYSGCQINNSVYEATYAYEGGQPGYNDPNLSIPLPPPAPVTDLNCVIKYERLTEAASGNCIYDDTTPEASTTPEAIRWTETTCTVGTDNYQVRTKVRGQSYSAWSDLGANVSEYVFPTPFIVGTYVTAEVRAYCVQGEDQSDYSSTSALSQEFKVDYPPPAINAIEVSWTPSTAGVGETGAWLDVDTQQGDSFMYDRMIGVASGTCDNNVIPSGWRFNITATFPDGTVRYLETHKIISGANPTIDRSTWTGAQDLYWSRGAEIQLTAEAQCPSVGGVYPATYTLPDNTDTPVAIGYPILASETISTSCVAKYQRSTEASKGNCTLDASVAEQATVPNALKWTSTNCTTGYTPQYAFRQGSSAWSDWGTPLTTELVGLTPETAYTYEVKYKCVGNGGRYSTDSVNFSKSFTTSYPKYNGVAPAASAATWVPSTQDSSFALTTQQGDSFLYDRFSGTLASNSCPTGYSPKSLTVRLNNGAWSPSAIALLTPSVVDRSTNASLQPYWTEGSNIVIESVYNCSNPDYVDLVSSEASTAAPIKIGITSPSITVSGFTCYVPVSRSTEASKGSCTQSATVNTTYVPAELRWNAVAASACVAPRVGVPRYYISANNGSSWTALGTAVTSYTVGNNITPGTSYTYAVAYDCFDSASGRYSALSPLTAKTFTASYKNGAVSMSGSFSWSTADSSWTTTSSGGYSMSDRVTYSGSGTCPMGYTTSSNSIQVGNTSVSGFTINRSSVSSPSTYWGEGDVVYVTATVTCTGGDYGTKTASDNGSSNNMGVLPPTSAGSVSFSYTGGSATSATASVSSSPSCGSGVTPYYALITSAPAAAGSYSYTDRGPVSSASVTGYFGTYVTAYMAGYCSKNGISSSTVETGEVMQKINGRRGNIVTVSTRATTTTTISGGNVKSCMTGSSEGVVGTGQYGYNGSGLSGPYVYYSDPGSFDGAAAVTGITLGTTWSRAGYDATFAAQPYGFRVQSRTCVSNVTTASPMGIAGATMTQQGYATFFIKSSTSGINQNYPSYTYYAW